MTESRRGLVGSIAALAAAFIAGIIFVVACDNGPGGAEADAHEAEVAPCTHWNVRSVRTPVLTPLSGDETYDVPEGWEPFSGGGDDDFKIWLRKCAD